MIALLLSASLLVAQPAAVATAQPVALQEADDDTVDMAQEMRELRELMSEMYRQNLAMQREFNMPVPEGQLTEPQFELFLDLLFEMMAEEERRHNAGEPLLEESEFLAEMERRWTERTGLPMPPRASDYAMMAPQPGELDGMPPPDADDLSEFADVMRDIQELGRQSQELADSGALDAPGAEPASPRDPLQPGFEYQTPEERLADRLDALALADERQAVPLIDEIRALWRHSGSDTISLLMDRGQAAELAGNQDIAARMYDHVTRLKPDFAEGWLAAGRMAAYAEDWSYALETLNTALTLEPRRYDAYMALGRVLESAEAYEAALEAYNTALDIYPVYQEALSARERLEAARAGRPL